MPFFMNDEQRSITWQISHSISTAWRGKKCDELREDRKNEKKDFCGQVENENYFDIYISGRSSPLNQGGDLKRFKSIPSRTTFG